jgi:hypothetical protein
MNFLAFDQAPNHTGWAASSDEEGAKVHFGTLSMSDYGDNDQRMARDLEFEIVGLLKKFQPRYVFFEQIVVKTHKGVPILNMPVLYAQFTVACTIQVVCMQHNVECEMILIADWRKRFLGRSNMPKWAGKKGKGRDWLKEAAMIECARRNLLPANDHEAEAIGILDYGIASKSFDYRFRTKGDVERKRLAAAREEMQK